MKTKIISSSQKRILSRHVFCSPGSGKYMGRVITNNLDNTLIGNSIIDKLSKLQEILELSPEMSEKDKYIFKVIISILKDYYIHHNNLDSSADIKLPIDSMLEEICSKYSYRFTNVTSMFEINIMLMKKLGTASRFAMPEAFEKLQAFDVELSRFSRHGINIKISDFLGALEKLEQHSLLLHSSAKDLEMLRLTLQLTSHKQYFFINGDVDLLKSSYLDKYLYDNPYYLGTMLTTINAAAHISQFHIAKDKIIVKVDADDKLPEFISLNVVGNHGYIHVATESDALIHPILEIAHNISTILPRITLKDSDSKIKLTSLDYLEFLDVGLIRMESLHKTLFSNFSNTFYKNTLLPHLLKLYKGKTETLTFRLTEFTSDKKYHGIDTTEYSSLQFLLNTETGRKILRADIRLLLKLKASGLNVELLIPNPLNVTEINEIKLLINEVHDELIKYDNDYPDINLELPIGAMIENPNIIKELPEVLDTVDFVSLGLNDMTHIYEALQKHHPEIFEEGLINLNKLKESYIKDYSDRGHHENSSTHEIFLAPDFVRFIKAQFFDQINENNKHKLRACGDINQYIAAILIGLGIKSINTNTPSLRKLCEFIPELSVNELDLLIERICLAEKSDMSSETIRLELKKLAEPLTTN